MSAIVLRFTARLVGVPDVTRTIDVLSTQTLHDLHCALQDALVALTSNGTAAHVPAIVVH